MIFMVFFQNVNFELKLITNECEKSILLPGHYVFAANQSLSLLFARPMKDSKIWNSMP